MSSIRNEVVVGGGPLDGPREKWSGNYGAGNQYGGACDFATRLIGPGSGALLCVGSPEFEVAALSKLGWNVTFLDVRIPPWKCKDMRIMDVLDLEEESAFDALSSTCVLTHAGTTRYGDKALENGDVEALRRMRRALKPGARFALQLGGVIEGDTSVLVGATHRIYTVSEGERIVREAGFTIEETAVWSREGWKKDATGHKETANPTAYLCIGGRC